MLAYPRPYAPGLTTLGRPNAARSTHHRIAWLTRESSSPQRGRALDGAGQPRLVGRTPKTTSPRRPSCSRHCRGHRHPCRACRHLPLALCANHLRWARATCGTQGWPGRLRRLVPGTRLEDAFVSGWNWHLPWHDGGVITPHNEGSPRPEAQCRALCGAVCPLPASRCMRLWWPRWPAGWMRAHNGRWLCASRMRTSPLRQGPTPSSCSNAPVACTPMPRPSGSLRAVGFTSGPHHWWRRAMPTLRVLTQGHRRRPCRPGPCPREAFRALPGTYSLHAARGALAIQRTDFAKTADCASGSCLSAYSVADGVLQWATAAWGASINRWRPPWVTLYCAVQTGVGLPAGRGGRRCRPGNRRPGGLAANTPRQILLQQALGVPRRASAHPGWG